MKRYWRKEMLKFRGEVSALAKGELINEICIMMTKNNMHKLVNRIVPLLLEVLKEDLANHPPILKQDD
jgi:hypothetical protein